MRISIDPIQIQDWFGSDIMSHNLFIALLLRCAQRDGVFTDERGKSILIKKGQVIFGRNRYAQILNCSPKTAERLLTKQCTKLVPKVTKQTNSSFTIVTIENYDEIIGLTQQRPSSVLKVTTSIYNNKKEIKEKEIYKEKEKKERKPKNGLLKGDIPKLDYAHAYEIAKELIITVEDVMDIDGAVRDAISIGNKYNITNQFLTVKQWCRNALDRKNIQVRNSTEDLVFALETPENMEKSRLFNEKLKKENPTLI
jgi:hypothetical protein